MATFTEGVDTPAPNSHALLPRTVPEALSYRDAYRWKAAIDAWLGSCCKFMVWEEVHLSKGKQALPSFFVFGTKRDGRYKARLVAGGHRDASQGAPRRAGSSQIPAGTRPREVRFHEFQKNCASTKTGKKIPTATPHTLTLLYIWY
jgi:hypothetical protein